MVLFWVLKARKQNSGFVENVKRNFNCIDIKFDPSTKLGTKIGPRGFELLVRGVHRNFIVNFSTKNMKSKGTR